MAGRLVGTRARTLGLAGLGVMALAAPAAAAGAAHDAGALQSIHGRAYRTLVPSGWSIAHQGRTFVLGSPGAQVDQFDVPSAGGEAITIHEVSVRRLHRVQKRQIPHDPLKLERFVVGFPSDATTIGRSRPHQIRWAGARAALEVFAYRHDGRNNIQADVVIRRRGFVEVIEADSQPRRVDAAVKALTTVVERWWRWRR